MGEFLVRHTIIMTSGFSLLVLVLGLAHANPVVDEKDLVCDICIDIITDLDEWITSDSTEGEIIHFVESLCSALGLILPALEDICISIIEGQLPAIIDGLVEDNLNPQEVCESISA